MEELNLSQELEELNLSRILDAVPSGGSLFAERLVWFPIAKLQLGGPVHSSVQMCPGITRPRDGPRHNACSRPHNTHPIVIHLVFRRLLIRPVRRLFGW
jgi:hypothetical protein